MALFAPKVIGKLDGFQAYKTILHNMTVVLYKSGHSEEEHLKNLEDGKTDFFLDVLGKGNRKWVKEGVESFCDLHEMITKIGETFFSFFRFSTEMERVRDYGVNRVRLEDWSKIKNSLNMFADEAIKVFKGGSNRRKAAENIKKGTDRLEDIFKRISIQLRP